MAANPAAASVSPHQHLARQIAVLAGTDPRTVVARITGKRVRSTTADRIDNALRVLGLAHLVPDNGPEGGASHAP